MQQAVLSSASSEPTRADDVRGRFIQFKRRSQETEEYGFSKSNWKSGCGNTCAALVYSQTRGYRGISRNKVAR
jgi:hypothetical protein